MSAEPIDVFPALPYGFELEGDFVTQVEELRSDLVRFASWLCRDRVTGEDLVQETLLRAWRGRHALRDRRLLKAWLLTICRREHCRWLARRRHETTSLETLDPAEEPETVVACDDEIALHEALLALDAAYRDPLLMQLVMGYSTGEIAREMGLTLTATLTRLCRARTKLRAAVGHEMAQERGYSSSVTSVGS
jgi:RNA polymerase sigma-70 factor (ECF subfamily)